MRRKLGLAMTEFVQQIAALTLAEPDGAEESVANRAMRLSLTETYREAVEEAAAQGVEVALAWHTLGTWNENGRERIGYFARALDCVESRRDAHLRPPGPEEDWSSVHMRAECLFELGRVHANEGDAEVARGFLLRALPLAQEAERLRAAAAITHEDRLEGRIAELLVQLPDADDPPGTMPG